ncbi:MAG: hypothetical protein IJ689_03035 [Alphaproteobacteria bacterium]|nr:hypothetical protein [Alphaproteobacteria bacterium]
MNKYILMLGIAGVALGSYCAYAGNSATMTVTATIAHDVSLIVTQDMDLGTITINPAATEETEWDYDSDSGVFNLMGGDAIVSADNAKLGRFTANIPNPSVCGYGTSICGGLEVDAEGQGESLFTLFGPDYGATHCTFGIEYNGDGNDFRIVIIDCMINEGRISSVMPGKHTGTLTITYTAG